MGEQTVVEAFITFGSNHQEPHAHFGLGDLHNGWVVVEAPTYDIARKIAYDLFDNGRYAFDYPASYWNAEEHQADVLRWYPRGELLRIKWQLPSAEEVTKRRMASVQRQMAFLGESDVRMMPQDSTGAGEVL
jgi:hypothetical protein